MKNLPYARAIEERARTRTLPSHGRVIVLAGRAGWDAIKRWQLKPDGNRPFVMLPDDNLPSECNWSFARHFDMAILYSESTDDDLTQQAVGYLLMNPSMRLVLVSTYDLSKNEPITYWPERISR